MEEREGTVGQHHTCAAWRELFSKERERCRRGKTRVKKRRKPCPVGKDIANAAWRELFSKERERCRRGKKKTFSRISEKRENFRRHSVIHKNKYCNCFQNNKRWKSGMPREVLMKLSCNALHCSCSFYRIENFPKNRWNLIKHQKRSSHVHPFFFNQFLSFLHNPDFNWIWVCQIRFQEVLTQLLK